MRLVDLELDLDVFAGPFDLLLTLILREEIDLLEVDLAEVVIAYIDHLEQRGELELEAATEFLVLIAALLELKSRLLLPGEEQEIIELDPGEAAEELLARLLDAHRYRAAANHLQERLAEQSGYRFRSAPLPPSLRRASLQDAAAVYAPATLARAIGELLRMPEPVDLRHIGVPKVTVGRAAGAPAQAAGPRALQLRRGGRARRSGHGRGDAVRAARALQAGRGDLDPGRAVRRDHRRGDAVGRRPRRLRRQDDRIDRHHRPAPSSSARSSRCCSSAPSRSAPRRWPTPPAASCTRWSRRCERLREHYEFERRGLVLRELAGGYALSSHPDSEAAARRLLARPAHAAADPGAGRDAGDHRLPAAGVAARDRPDPRGRGRVGRRDAARARDDRGVRPVAVRRGPVPDHRAVPAAVRAELARGAAGHQASSTPSPSSSRSCASGC